MHADVPATSPGSARERALHALALVVDRRESEAVGEADAAAELAPAAAAVHLARSAVLREAGRLVAALAAADEALRLAPGDARAHHVRAAALAALGRTADARAAADRAARLAPDDAAVLRCLGELAIDVDPAEAERHFRRGVHRDPLSAAAHAGLARALRRLGRSEEANAEYERAAAIDPGIRELRRRGAALFSVIVQAAIGTFLAILVIGWLPDMVAVHRPASSGRVTVFVSILAAVGPLALLGWAAMRNRRLGREAPVPPGVREELRELADALAAGSAAGR
jgi:tetratricopeptide (TPR) repeat protein